MLFLALAVAAGVGFIAYEWFKPGATAPPGKPLRPAVVNKHPDRNEKCGLGPNDLADADKWTASVLGTALSLDKRLILMRSVTPYTMWPAFAVRADCVVNETDTFQVRPPHWKGP